MHATAVWPSVRILLTLLAALAITLVAGAANLPGNTSPQSPQRHILAFKPTTGELIPVTPAELRPGHIYSHYNDRLGRQVWSICRPDKTFWNALASGSCQAVHLFEWDVKTAGDEKAALDRLKDINRGVYDQVTQEGAAVFLELGRDGRWTLTRTSVPTALDAETGMRWEWQFGRYIPARRTSDYVQH